MSELRPHFKVLLHRHGGEKLSSFGDMADPHFNDSGSGGPADILSFKFNFSVPGTENARDGFEGG